MKGQLLNVRLFNKPRMTEENQENQEKSITSEASFWAYTKPKNVPNSKQDSCPLGHDVLNIVFLSVV
jgi:hypothetical protein